MGEIQQRVDRARVLGWVFEDTGLTPGVPRMAAVPPGKTREDAKMVWYLGWPGQEDQASKQLDDAGVPQ